MQYVIPIVALFQGRLIDRPEQSTEETAYSTGGKVGHKVRSSLDLCWPNYQYFSQISMAGRVLFCVIEVEMLVVDVKDSMTHLFLELLCECFS